MQFTQTVPSMQTAQTAPLYSQHKRYCPYHWINRKIETIAWTEPLVQTQQYGLTNGHRVKVTSIHLI